MPKLIETKTSFNAGQLSPSLLGRIDTEQYAAGASEMTNVIPKIQGGVKCRPAFTFVNVTQNNNPNKIIPFLHSKGDTAIIEMARPKILIWEMEGIHPNQTTAQTGLPSFSFLNPYSDAESQQVRFTQQYDTIFIVHPSKQPRRIVRRLLPTGKYDWKIEYIPFISVPDKDGEKAWGITKQGKRNYPSVVALFEGRLYMGATPEHPNVIWGSKVGNPFDFSNTSDKLADEAVEIELGGHGSVNIQHLYPQRVLFAFTDNGVYTTVESPITPAKAVMIRNAESGIAPHIPPVEMGQSIMFMKKDTTADKISLYEAQYDDNSKQFIMTDLAVVADDVIKNPIGLAVVNSTDDTGSHTAYILNDDSTIAVLTYMRAEKVRAWSVWKTHDKKIKDIISLDGNIFISTKYTRGDNSKYHLEALNNNEPRNIRDLLDNRVNFTNTGVSTPGVWIVYGNFMDVFKDGDEVDVVAHKNEYFEYQGKFTINPDHRTISGLSHDWDGVDVGFVFDWVVATMPHYVALYEKTTNNRRFRVLKTTVRMQNIKRLAVNGKAVPLSDADDMKFNEPTPAFSGVKTILHSGYIDVNDTTAKTTFTGDSIGGGEIMNVETVIKL